MMRVYSIASTYAGWSSSVLREQGEADVRRAEGMRRSIKELSSEQIEKLLVRAQRRRALAACLVTKP